MFGGDTCDHRRSCGRESLLDQLRHRRVCQAQASKLDGERGTNATINPAEEGAVVPGRHCTVATADEADAGVALVAVDESFTKAATTTNKATT